MPISNLRSKVFPVNEFQFVSSFVTRSFIITVYQLHSVRFIMLGTHIDFSFTFQRNHCLPIKYTNKERIFEQSSRDKGEIFRAQMATSLKLNLVYINWPIFLYLYDFVILRNRSG